MKYLLLLSVFLIGCSQFQSKTESTTDPLYKNKADIAITIGDQKFDGMAVTTLTGNMNIEIVSKAKLDVLIVSSCQRFETYEKLDSGWFGGAGKKFKYNYIPTKIELGDKCPLYFQALDKSGVTAWGYVAFKTTDKLAAEVECNGKSYLSTGFTLCQTKNGFEQGLTFLKPVTKFTASAACGITQLSPTQFRVVPLVGFCNATFTDGTDWHQLTLLGYEQAFVRGE